jgi:hypothetical protein
MHYVCGLERENAVFQVTKEREQREKRGRLDTYQDFMYPEILSLKLDATTKYRFKESSFGVLCSVGKVRFGNSVLT